MLTVLVNLVYYLGLFTFAIFIGTCTSSEPAYLFEASFVHFKMTSGAGGLNYATFGLSLIGVFLSDHASLICFFLSKHASKVFKQCLLTYGNKLTSRTLIPPHIVMDSFHHQVW